MPAWNLKPFDCHTHTMFSDGASTFEDNVRAAASVGCRALVAADHLTGPRKHGARERRLHARRAA